MGASANLLIDLMLLYVETGVKFTMEYGDIDENFYSSLESTYIRALKLTKKEGELVKFADRARKIVNHTEDIGWASMIRYLTITMIFTIDVSYARFHVIGYQR